MKVSSTLESKPAISETSGGGSSLGWLAVAHLLNDGAAFYLPAILPAILTELHYSVRMAGVLVTTLYVGQALQPVAGLWADYVGGRWLVIVGLLMCTCGAALIGLSPNIGVLILLILLSGLGSTIFHPQALAAVRSLTHKRHGLGMSVFLVGGELGRGLWPTLTSLIVVWLGLPSLWLIALPTVALLPVLMRTTPSLPARHEHAPPINWKAHRRPALVLVMYSALRGVVCFGTIAFVPFLWKSRGGALVSGASILTALLVTGVAGQIAGGAIADRFGRRHLLMTSALLLALLTPLWPAVSGLLLWLLAAVLGVVMFCTFSATLIIGQDIFVENKALGSGIALGFSNAIGAICLAPLGLAAKAWGVNSIFYLLTGAAILMCGSALLISKRVHPAMH